MADHDPDLLELIAGALASHRTWTEAYAWGCRGCQARGATQPDRRAADAEAHVVGHLADALAAAGRLRTGPGVTEVMAYDQGRRDAAEEILASMRRIAEGKTDG